MRMPETASRFRFGGASAVAAAAALAFLPAPAAAQNGEKRDSVAQDAVDAVASPLRDLNIKSRDIPDILLLAQSDPYRMDGLEQCRAIWDEVDQLDDVLGPDADEEKDKEGLINKSLRTGSKLVYGFIPFRGLVRRISGARSHEAEFESAIYAGVARRSYLKGVALGRTCERPDPEEIAIEDAHALLGMEQREKTDINAPAVSEFPD
ncbi:hypothetical protein ACRAQ6_08010 [Erythrobacter sp. HA6-11]